MPILAFYDLTINKWAQLGIVVSFFFFFTLIAWAGLAFIRHQKR